MPTQRHSAMSSFGAVMPSAARGILSSCSLPLRQRAIAPASLGLQQVRGFKDQKKGKGKGKSQPKSDRKGNRDFQQKNLADMERFALCDAMR